MSYGKKYFFGPIKKIGKKSFSSRVVSFGQWRYYCCGWSPLPELAPAYSAGTANTQASLSPRLCSLMWDAPLHNCCLYSMVACFQLAVSANLHLNVLCRMSTPTANMDPDQPNAETRGAKARLVVSEIVRVQLEAATGPTWGCDRPNMHAARGLSHPSAFYLQMCHEWSWGYFVFLQVLLRSREAWWLGRASGKDGSTFDRLGQGRQEFRRPVCRCRVRKTLKTLKTLKTFTFDEIQS